MEHSWGRAVVGAAGIGLAAYSLWLVGLEVVGGQEALRPYVADVDGPITLFGLNTEMVTWLLVGAAVLWLAGWGLAGGRRGRRYWVYAPLQAALLLALAFDDRFGVHERLGGMTGLPDTLILGLLGAAQLGLIARFPDIAAPDRRSRVALLLAAVMFGLMVAVDGLLPGDLRLRLAAEELTKLWGAVMMAWWSWVRLRTAATHDEPDRGDPVPAADPMTAPAPMDVDGHV